MGYRNEARLENSFAAKGLTRGMSFTDKAGNIIKLTQMIILKNKQQTLLKIIYLTILMYLIL